MEITVSKFFKVESTVGKSKFISIVFPCFSIEEFKTRLNQVKIEYPNATHYCYAYRIQNEERSDDAGEPSGSAGAPILSNLKLRDLQYVALIIVRYFAPPKLGIGLLTRSYNALAKEILNEVETCSVKSVYRYQIEVGFDTYGSLINQLRKDNEVVAYLESPTDANTNLMKISIVTNENKYIDMLINAFRVKIVQADSFLGTGGISKELLQDE